MTLGGSWTFKIELSPRRGLDFHKNLQSMKNTKMIKSCSKTDQGRVGQITFANPKIDVLPAWELNFKHFLFFMIFEGSLEIAILPALVT